MAATHGETARILSFVAFIAEEIIEHCESCGGLYFFEFVSCSAFLLALLVLVVYLTPLRNKVNITSFQTADFWITLVVGVLLLLASIIFAATMDKDVRAQVSVGFGFLAGIAFVIDVGMQYKNGHCPFKKKTTANGTNGTPEGQPLNTPVQAQGPSNA
ncbi:CKLF-like MARVEL transmembrane domain-containing protein 6 [Pelodytes ibericus]